MTGRGLVCAGIAALVAGLLLGSPPASAAASREDVRLTLLDTCVMAEWARREDTSKVAKECGCAAARTAKALSAASVKAFETSLSKNDQKLWTDATKAGFR